METRQELEEEIKTLKYLRRTSIESVLVAAGVTLLCFQNTYHQQPEIVFFGGLTTLLSGAFCCENLSEIIEDSKAITEAHREIRYLDNPLLTRPKLY